MARQEGTLKLSSNIEARFNAPLDARSVVPTKADLYSLEYVYDGMIVGLKTGGMFQLIGSDPTVEANWKPYTMFDEVKDLFIIPIDEADLSQSAVQAQGVLEGRSAYSLNDIYTEYLNGKVCAAQLSNSETEEEALFLPLQFYGDPNANMSQAWAEHVYFEYPTGVATNPVAMMLTLSIVRQDENKTMIYLTKNPIRAEGASYELVTATEVESWFN